MKLAGQFSNIQGGMAANTTTDFLVNPSSILLKFLKVYTEGDFVLLQPSEVCAEKHVKQPEDRLIAGVRQILSQCGKYRYPCFCAVTAHSLHCVCQL